MSSVFVRPISSRPRSYDVSGCFEVILLTSMTSREVDVHEEIK